jgi:hypothetical protein
MIELVETPKKIVTELGLGEPIETAAHGGFQTTYKYAKNGVVYEIEQHAGGYFNIRMDSPVFSFLYNAILEIEPYTNAAHSCVVDYGALKVICSPAYMSVMQRD